MKDYIEDKRGVLIYAIEDHENGLIAGVGTQVTVMEENIDPNSPSGYSYLVECGYEKRLYHVDKSYVIPKRQWNTIYNAILHQHSTQLRRGGYSR